MNKERTYVAFFIIIFALTGCMSTAMFDYNQAILQSYTDSMRVARGEYTVEVESTETVLAQPDTIVINEYSGSGLSWIINKVSDGTPQTSVEEYHIVKDTEGNIVSKTLNIESTADYDAQPVVYQYGGSVQEGSYFYPKMTTYGVDCVGCGGETTGTGGTAGGIKLSVSQGVLQPNGTWRSGIQYGGYYLLAADKNLPMCSILEISDHGYSGAGLVPGVPFKAMVVDRGGGVNGAHLDLYGGSEKSPVVQRANGYRTKATVIRVGGRSGNSCAL